MMLASDLALGMDEELNPIATAYAEDLELLTESFAKAWYKLTTQDKGPHSRCVGEEVPPPQTW